MRICLQQAGETEKAGEMSCVPGRVDFRPVVYDQATLKNTHQIINSITIEVLHMQFLIIKKFLCWSLLRRGYRKLSDIATPSFLCSG